MKEIFKQISINSQRSITLAHQIKQQIEWMIASGTIKPDERLPSVRRLAEQLDINMHTVRNAYAMLENEGLVETRQGWGTKVLTVDPLRIAQSLVSVRSHTFGVIVPSLSNPVYHDFLRGIYESADTDQSLIFVCDSQDEPSEAWRYFKKLLAKQVDGIIVASQDIEQFFPRESDFSAGQSLGVPVVSVDWPKSSLYSVLVDLENAGYQATRHLLQHGHQRIGLITFGYETLDFRPENDGYRRALAEAGIEIDPGLIAPVTGFDTAEGRKAAAKLLRLPQPPAAIFAITDLMAVGAMQAIKDSGRRIPEDMALVGFNDIPTAAMLDPPLTTVSLSGYDMGSEAMNLLTKLISGTEPERRKIILPTTLVIRRSCGCAHE